ncbi:hypothetical protein G3N95_33995 [Paraburkholderia sp. Tr-20389]|uniref:hypothetical protein n=1 Tax=Paraburkholderia sp. Tr-20389 TaxID=2703903 RepID=UPI00197F2B6B|nr:hypothetical protein [Paraburkholderia sp. Tr-20389]MBN3757972.1 hypothetical protein [Paraburkholderia sp. Tr-20389]
MNGDLFFVCDVVAIFACGAALPVLVFVFAFAFAGIRVLVLVAHALPLCGAAPTFLCSGKEK